VIDLINPITAIRACFKLNRAIKDIKGAEMKSGWKSTEFWTMTVIPTVAGFWLSYGNMIPKELTIKIVASMIALYGILRTLLKIVALIAPYTKTTVDDEIVEHGSEILDAAESAFKPKN
jgi:hypothetical protein